MIVRTVRFLVMALLATTLGAAGGSLAFVGQPLPYTTLPDLPDVTDKQGTREDEIGTEIRHKMEWRMR